MTDPSDLRTEISPEIFAAAIRLAQGKRAQGDPCYMAAATTLRDLYVSDVWASVLCGFLNDSPSIAEDWASRVVDRRIDSILSNFNLKSETGKENDHDQPHS